MEEIVYDQKRITWRSSESIKELVNRFGELHLNKDMTEVLLEYMQQCENQLIKYESLLKEYDSITDEIKRIVRWT